MFPGPRCGCRRDTPVYHDSDGDQLRTKCISVAEALRKLCWKVTKYDVNIF